jgi:uncharacterized protein YprB with RNaseH-like and TPR domain
LISLADRIRGVVGATHPVARIPGESRPSTSPERPELVEGRIPNPESLNLSALCGAWRANCFVVERRWEPTARHGREDVGALAQLLDEASSEAALFTPGAPARPPFMFFDLETTGLSGGAGTQAFLVGCAWFEEDRSFVTRQFLLTRYVDERPFLEAVAVELARAGALVTFNGKSFDAPVLETRYLFHRLTWIGGGLPHLDVLHPARRFWRTDVGRAFKARLDGDPERVALHRDPGCSLVALERQILGARRVGDVPGFEIPGRYFQFVRSGDPRPIAAVLEHNRLDLLTLASLTARLLHLTRIGPEAARDPRETLALGYVYARAGCEDRARAAYRHAVDRCRSPRGAYDPIRIEALRLLALAWRRARRYEEAASCWGELLDVRGCPPPIARQATEALAIHHEHRRRDLTAAKTFALRTLEIGPPTAWVNATRHRLARLERKMGRFESLKFEV